MLVAVPWPAGRKSSSRAPRPSLVATDSNAVDAAPAVALAGRVLSQTEATAFVLRNPTRSILLLLITDRGIADRDDVKITVSVEDHRLG